MAVAPRWRRTGQHLGDDLMEHVFDRIIERNRRRAVLAKGAEVWAQMGSGTSTEHSPGESSVQVSEDRIEQVEALAVAIIKTLQRRSSRCENEDEMIHLLAKDEVTFQSSESASSASSASHPASARRYTSTKALSTSRDAAGCGDVQ
jgi:hypothetical protein